MSEEEIGTVLDAVEDEMESQGLRGHVYLTQRATVVFATRRNREGKPLKRNIGPAAVRSALNRALNARTTSDEWLENLRRHQAGSAPAAPVIRDTPHLVVTGAMAQRVLYAVCEHPSEYSSDLKRTLETESGLDEKTARKVWSRIIGEKRPTDASSAR